MSEKTKKYSTAKKNKKLVDELGDRPWLVNLTRLAAYYYTGSDPVISAHYLDLGSKYKYKGKVTP